MDKQNHRYGVAVKSERKTTLTKVIQKTMDILTGCSTQVRVLETITEGRQ